MDWRKGLADASASGGLAFGLEGEKLDDFNVVIEEPKIDTQDGSPRRMRQGLQTGGGKRNDSTGNHGKVESFYDIDDAERVAGGFISRVSSKLRKLSECKKGFEDVVRRAVKEQERKYEKMRNFVDEKGELAVRARKLVLTVRDKFEVREEGGERSEGIGGAQRRP